MFLLSIGHHPEAPGATNGKYNEFDLASEWVERIEDIMSSSGFPIEVVPEGTLREKIDFINAYRGAEFAAELHFNSNVAKAFGSESLYYPDSDKGKRFAEMIQDEFKKRQIFQPDRGVKEGYYYKKGEKSEDVLAFLEETTVPSVVIEPEFISHPDIINKYHYEGCDAIAQAADRMKKWMDSLND